MKRKILILYILVVFVNSYLQLYINEFLTSNSDPDNTQFVDWIEVYNGNL